MNIPYMMHNSPCYICHNHGDDMLKIKLKRMLDICKNLGIEQSTKRHDFMWGFNSHCKYGLSCPKLDQFNRECESLAQNVEPYIAGLAEANGIDKKYNNAYHDVLNLCRGDFPAVYKRLEIINFNSAASQRYDKTMEPNLDS